MEAHELLQAIQALGEQPKITVSVEVKRSVGQWESVTGGAFLTFHLPAGTTMEELLAQYAVLNAQAHAIAEAEAEASYQRHMEMARQRAEAATTEAATQREAQERRPVNVQPHNHVTAPNITPTPEGGRELSRAPKADQRQPGDWWHESATEYRLIIHPESPNPRTGEMEAVAELEFYRSGLDGAVGRIKSWQEAWPDSGWFDVNLDGWRPHMGSDGQKHQLPSPARLTLRVGNKVIARTGNYHVDLISIQ